MTLADKIRAETEKAIRQEEEKRRKEREEKLEAAKERGRKQAEHFIENAEEKIRKAAAKGMHEISLGDPSFDDNAYANYLIDKWAQENGFHTHSSHYYDADMGHVDSASLCWSEHKNDRVRW